MSSFQDRSKENIREIQSNLSSRLRPGSCQSKAKSCEKYVEFVNAISIETFPNRQTAERLIDKSDLLFVLKNIQIRCFFFYLINQGVKSTRTSVFVHRCH